MILNTRWLKELFRLKYIDVLRPFLTIVFLFLFFSPEKVAAQVNLGFEDGTFNGWEGQIEQRNRLNENTVVTPGILQHCIMNNTMEDPLIPGLSVVPPNKTTSCRIGNTVAGGNVASLRQSFIVDSSNMIFTYSYAVVLEDPANDLTHVDLARPHFQARMLDENGNEITCAEYTVVVGDSLAGSGYIHHCVEAENDDLTPDNVGCPAGALGNDGSPINNFITSFVSDETCEEEGGFGAPRGPRDIFYQEWTSVSLALNEYEGREVTIEFVASDCQPGGHRGYAYVSAEAIPLDVSEPGTICYGKETKNIIAPEGFERYEWKGPEDGIISADTIQTIEIDRVGTYTVTLYPFSDNPCPVEVEYIARPGCPPAFKAESLCETQKGSAQAQEVDLLTYNNYVTDNGEIGDVQSWHSDYPTDQNKIDDPSNITITGTDTLYVLASLQAAPRPDTVGFILSVDSRPDIIFPDIDPICSTTPAFQINGISPLGGTFSGSGLISETGILTPSEPGEHIVKYEVVNTAGCLDTITKKFNIAFPPSVDAGEDRSICDKSNSTSLEGIVTNAEKVIWTGGTGTFSDPENTSTLYTGSKADSISGSVTLTLSTTDENACPPASDEVVLTFVPSSDVNAGPDQTLCSDNAKIELAATAENITNGSWMGGKGTFSPDNTTANVSYAPTQEELNKGYVVLAFRVSGQEPCPFVTDSVKIEFIKPPTADAGNDLKICSLGSEVEIEGIVENASGSKWSGGKGTFKNGAGNLKTLYVPDESEREQGNILLTLTAEPIAPCNASEDDMTISLEAPPVVNAGPDLSICDIERQVVMQGTFNNSTGGVWSTNGTGLFNEKNSMTSEYTLSESDIKLKSVFIILTSTGNELCDATSDTLSINVFGPPGGSLLPEYKFCEEDSSTIVLDPGLTTNDIDTYKYEWSTGDTTSKLEASESGTYHVLIRNKAGCTTKLNTNIRSICPPRLFISDAFSPNMDGINENYHVYGAHIGRFQMFIFNRWGEIIFRTDKFEDAWDGKYLGKNIELGVYPWIITYEGDSEEYKGPYAKEGSVTVIR